MEIIDASKLEGLKVGIPYNMDNDDLTCQDMHLKNGFAVDCTNLTCTSKKLSSILYLPCTDTK